MILMDANDVRMYTHMRLHILATISTVQRSTSKEVVSRGKQIL